MTFDQFMHPITRQPMTARDYGKVMRRFRKAILRSLGLALFLLPLHVASTLSHAAQEPVHVILALLAGVLSCMLTVSVLGMTFAWANRPR